METKLCRKCNVEKNIDDFRSKKDKCGKYYRYSYCKECEKEYANNEMSKERKKVVDKKYRKNNMTKIYLYVNKRKKIDKLFKLKCQIRSLIWQSFNKKGKNKYEKSSDILGCDLDYFISYLLETFKNNYGYEYNGKEKVHIDHIVPLKYAKTENEVMKLCHYTNLQLLKAKDNLKKGDKLNWEL